MINLLKFIILPVILFLVFNFLEYGLSWNGADKFLIPGLLTAISIISFFISKFRKLLLILSVILLTLMVLFYLIDKLTLSNRVGSFGFALFVILIISYLPILVRKGYIEKL